MSGVFTPSSAALGLAGSESLTCPMVGSCSSGWYFFWSQTFCACPHRCWWLRFLVWGSPTHPPQSLPPLYASVAAISEMATGGPLSSQDPVEAAPSVRPLSRSQSGRRSKRGHSCSRSGSLSVTSSRGSASSSLWEKQVF